MSDSCAAPDCRCLVPCDEFFDPVDKFFDQRRIKEDDFEPIPPEELDWDNAEVHPSKKWPDDFKGFGIHVKW